MEERHSGIAKYAYHILDYIVADRREDRFVLIINSMSESFIRELYPQFKYIIIGRGVNWKNRVMRAVSLSFEFKKAVNSSGSGIVFCPWANYITFLSNSVRVISVIHDMQHLVYLRGFQKLKVRFMYGMIIRNSNAIVTVSDFSRKQILDFFPDTKLHIYNFSNSVSMIDKELPLGMVDGEYILFVGRFCEMKNVGTLLRAFSRLLINKKELKLVLVGKQNNYYYNIMLPLIKDLRLGDKVMVLSDCSEKEISALYRDAKLFVFPSLHEGFGFPPIEAACMKTPVITTGCDSIKEVTKGLLYYYNDPMDYVELEAKMVEVLDDYPSAEKLSEIKRIYDETYSKDIIGKGIVDFLCGNYTAD